MKKNWIPTTVLIVIGVITAAVFAEEAVKTRPAGRPERPVVRTPGSRAQGPQRIRNMDAIIKRKAKIIEAEITGLKKLNEAETGQLKAILKQAEEEKATKTAAMLKNLIKKKNAETEAKIQNIQKQAEDFKKRLKRPLKSKEAPSDKQLRENKPPRKPRTRTRTSNSN